MRLIQWCLQILLVSVLSASALAHQGHDHSHWTSSILHVLFYASIAITAAGVSYACYKLASKILTNKAEKANDQHNA